jgi:hypothetical protein
MKGEGSALGCGLPLSPRGRGAREQCKRREGVRDAWWVPGIATTRYGAAPVAALELVPTT